ncbi:MAG: hypothetical protein JW990_14815 [Thermoleophilia bacterium]|nr:hypothetical protein [Thermoleophilia bacterium]
MSTRLEDGRPAQELRREREQRLMDSIHLEPVDRVSVGCELGFFIAKYAGIPCSASYYDCDAWMAACRKTLEDFQPDLVFLREFAPGKALELLQPKNLLWPGHGTDPECGEMQVIEIDSLGEDEYDYFMKNPADFMLRHHLPRNYDGLKVLSMLPELDDIAWFEPWAAERLAMFVADPEVETALQSLLEAGRELRRWQPKVEAFDQLLADCGIPGGYQGAVLPPYDVVSHSVRGMKGTMLDIFRQPDKLLGLCEYVLEKYLAKPNPPANEYGNTKMFMTNTRGSDNFMSNEQFERFYWPHCKKLLLTLIERGVTPCMFFEGNFDTKLEYLLQLPKGSMLVRLDRTDIFKAKEILGGHLCLEGNVPVSLLQMGSVQEVKDYCKKLIDVVGKDGGFVLSPRSSTHLAKPENLKAMIDFTKEYGRY